MVPLLAVGSLLVATTVGIALWSARPEPSVTRTPEGDSGAVLTTFRSSGSALMGLDRSGNVALDLTHPDGRVFDGRAVAVRASAPDEASLWIVAANALGASEGNIEEGELFVLGMQGHIAWRRGVTSSVAFVTETFGPPWVSEDVAVSGKGAALRVVWAVRHHTWWPSVLRVFGPDGETLGDFVNSGWILNVLVGSVGGSDRILAGGISNSRRSAMLAVLRLDSIRGSSPEEEGSPFACADCPPGAPERYLLFAPTEVSRVSGVPYNRTLQVTTSDDGIQIWTQEGPVGSNVAWVYRIAPDFRSARAAPSDDYWVRHEALYTSGDLDHPASACPERRTPPVVRLWQAETGWSVIPTVLAPAGD